MKETPISNLERTFLLEGLQDGKRLDGRSLDERRRIEIHFGDDFGSCMATLGNTRVLATVTASVTEPSQSRPCEGILQIFLDFSPMCAPRFSDGRSSAMDDEGTEVTRLLERCLKESKSLDMESLCIVAEEKVWAIRLELRVLNHEGSVADCASVAGLAALAHFKRPDVTLQGDIVQIHPVHERDPVPLAVHHYPVCSTFAFFNQSSDNASDQRIVAADPIHTEEAVMSGKLVLGVNPYREICTLHLAGQMVIEKDVVLRLAHRAGENSKEVVAKLKAALAKDQEARAKGSKMGLANLLLQNTILQNEEERPKFDLEKLIQLKVEEGPPEKSVGDVEIVEIDQGLVEMIEKQKSETRKEQTKKNSERNEKSEAHEMDSDSEEEEVSMVRAENL